MGPKLLLIIAIAISAAAPFSARGDDAGAGDDSSGGAAVSAEDTKECRAHKEDFENFKQAKEDAEKFNGQTEDGPGKQALKSCVERSRESYHTCAKPLDDKDLPTLDGVEGMNGQSATLESASSLSEYRNKQRSKDCQKQRDEIKKNCADQSDGVKQEMQLDLDREQSEAQQMQAQDPSGKNTDIYKNIEDNRQKHVKYRTNLYTQMDHLRKLNDAEDKALQNMSKCNLARAAEAFQNSQKASQIDAMTRTTPDGTASGSQPDKEKGWCRTAHEGDNEFCVKAAVVTAGATAEDTGAYLAKKAGTEAAAKTIENIGKTIGPILDMATGDAPMTAIELASNGAKVGAGAAGGPVSFGLLTFGLLMGGSAGGPCDQVFNNAYDAEAAGCSSPTMAVQSAVQTLSRP